MMNKKAVASFELILVFLSIFAFAFLFSDKTLVSAVTIESEPTYCCEETTLGGTCLNAPLSNCSVGVGLLNAPTSCEYTGYCQSGTCYNSQDGMCMQNTARRTCEEYPGATWSPLSIEQVGQCQMGCCIIADQAAFVTSTRCDFLTPPGIQNIYRPDITNELDCIAMANSQDKGACVYMEDYQRQCEFTTRGECGAAYSSELDADGNVSISNERTFYKDFLCSNDDLDTICAKAKSTTCYNGDVYWVDSCGNRENVFAGETEEEIAKSVGGGKVIRPVETPDSWEGNCDYLQGTRCGEINRYIVGGAVKHECKFTNCTVPDSMVGTTKSAGDELRNGESICINPGDGTNEFTSNTDGSPSSADGGETVGSRYFRGICRDGELVVEPCADYRNEICVEGEVAVRNKGSSFSSSMCRVNRWEDCMLQEYEEDCNNTAKRDCKWFPSFAGLLLANPDSDGEPQSDGVCVPAYAPGTNFWEEGSSDEICQIGSSSCTVTTTNGSINPLNGHIDIDGALAGGDFWVKDGEPVSGAEGCGNATWVDEANQVCVAMGDCGGYVNYVGSSGSGYQYTKSVYDDKEEEWVITTESGKENSGDSVSIGMNWPFSFFLKLTGRATAPITGNIIAGGVTVIEATVRDGRHIIINNADGTQTTYVDKDGDGRWLAEGSAFYPWAPIDASLELLSSSGIIGSVSLMRIARGDSAGNYIKDGGSWISGTTTGWSPVTNNDVGINLDEAILGNIVTPDGETLSEDISGFAGDISPEANTGISNQNLLTQFGSIINVDPNAIEGNSAYSNIYGFVKEKRGDYMVIQSGDVEIIRDGDSWTANGEEIPLTDSRRDALEAFIGEADQGENFNILTDASGGIYLEQEGEWQKFDYQSGAFNDVELTVEEQTELAAETPEGQDTAADAAKAPFDGKKFLGAMIESGGVAVAAFTAAKIVAQLEPWFFNDASQEGAFSYSIAAGAFTLNMLSEYGVKHALGWGALVGVAIFALTYADEHTESYEFDCMPWQAPTGGDDCEACNDNDIPCSEYRCRSLGQTCELVNQGSEEEKCVNVDPNDATPPVVYPDNRSSENIAFTDISVSPPDPGFTVIYTGEKPNSEGDSSCIPAFTPLTIAVSTRDPDQASSNPYDDDRGELAQCKIDFKSTESFDEMASFMGGDNYYKYTHTETFSLPTVEDLASSGFELENGNEMSFFIRCQDRSGNVNEAEFEVRFCIDPTPDTTAPIVKTTSIVNGACIAEDKLNVEEVKFYTDEPAECKWSDDDKSYESMEYEMSVGQSTADFLFPHTATLTGVTSEGTDYYVRCNDSRGNMMSESYVFSLRSSTGLVMKNLQPNGTETIFGAVDPTPVELYVETSYGCNDGMSTCSYVIGKENKNDDGNNYIPFFDTNNVDGVHTQKLKLNQDTHDVFVRCVDAGGNVARGNTSIKVEIDEGAPIVARVYEEAGKLKLVTVRDSECRYTFDSCDFQFLEGIEMPYPESTTHVADWDGEKTYYIKCEDDYTPVGNDCSIIVSPTEKI